MRLHGLREELCYDYPDGRYCFLFYDGVIAKGEPEKGFIKRSGGPCRKSFQRLFSARGYPFGKAAHRGITGKVPCRGDNEKFLS